MKKTENKKVESKKVDSKKKVSTVKKEEEVNKKSNLVPILILALVLVVLIIFLVHVLGVKEKKYKNDYYSFTYNTTWKLEEDDKDTILTHKKSKGKITVTYKVLDTYLIDVRLKDIISDLIYDIEQQNKGYKLINKELNQETGNYKLLYEKDDEQCLINIIKKDTVIVFVYYNTQNKYFDITMDNLDTIIDSLKIYSGEKINEKN